MRTRTLLLFFFLLILSLAVFASCSPSKTVDGIVVDDGNQPIRGARIASGDHSTLTDANGRFELALPPGSSSLAISAEGYTRVEQAVSIVLWSDPPSIRVTLPPNEFTGIVRAVDTGSPIAGAKIAVGGEARATTDAKGGFILRRIKTGTEIAISAAGYRSQTFAYQNDGPRQIQLAPLRAVIRVVDGFSDKPLPNARVAAGERSAVTNAYGRAELGMPPAGTEITATAAGYGSGKATWSGEELLVLKLLPAAVQGRLIETATKAPIIGARIQDGKQIVETDESGKYQLQEPTLPLTLTVKAAGYRLASVGITRTEQLELKLDPFKAKGIHIYYAEPRDEVIGLLNGLKGTAVNAVVLDVKEGPGEIVWESAVPLAKEIRAYHQRGIPPQELVAICRERGWYCIARQVIFKDHTLGVHRPDLALHFGARVVSAAGEVWMNPAKKEVWDYNLALATELSAMGFDEVQFDYIRYPGTSQDPVEAGTAASRVSTIKSFLQYASKTFSTLPAFFSGDTFGLTVAVKDEQRIGQVLEEDAPYFDYISPMLYPSTWKNSPVLVQNGLGIPNCRSALACPYDIIYRGTLLAYKRGKTFVRPWLQAYADTNFGVAQYVQQRKGADDADSAGWLFWNNQGNYPDGMWQ